MKKSRLSLLLGSTFLVGILIGLVVGGVLRMHFVGPSVANRVVAANVALDIENLRNIRHFHSHDPVELLETGLDGYIVAIGMELAKVPPARRDRWLLKALEQARNYRQVFPHEAGSPDDEALVKKALSLVSGEDSP